jgi:hypothetical protein
VPERPREKRRTRAMKRIMDAFLTVSKKRPFCGMSKTANVPFRERGTKNSGRFLFTKMYDNNQAQSDRF